MAVIPGLFKVGGSARPDTPLLSAAAKAPPRGLARRDWAANPATVGLRVMNLAGNLRAGFGNLGGPRPLNDEAGRGGFITLAIKPGEEGTRAGGRRFPQFPRGPVS